MSTSTTPPIRAVIDTSSLVPSRQRRELQQAAQLGAFIAIWSPWIIAELNRVLVSTQIFPYLLEQPDATIAQAFEHTKVGDWRQFVRSPFERGYEPPTAANLEQFLEACARWERAWEILVHTNLVHEVGGNAVQEYRLKEAARRIVDRAQALARRINDGADSPDISGMSLTQPILLSPVREPTAAEPCNLTDRD